MWFLLGLWSNMKDFRHRGGNCLVTIVMCFEEVMQSGGSEKVSLEK